MITGRREECPLTGSSKSHPSLPSPLAQKLTPRLRLPRSCLPLAYLDPLGGPHDLQGSNLFSAHIEVLEETVQDDRRSNQPTVLIAQSAADDGLFAIERVQEGIYALCRLGTWVGVNTLEQLQTVPTNIARPQKRQCREQLGLPGDGWWNTAATDFRSKDRHGPGKNSSVEKTRGVRLCLQVAQRKPTTPAQITQEISQPVLQDQTEEVVTDMVMEAAQDPEEVFRMIRLQYQEALYASKVRLFSCTSPAILLIASQVVVGIFCKGAIVTSKGYLFRSQWLCQQSSASDLVLKILHPATRYYGHQVSRIIAGIGQRVPFRLAFGRRM